MSTYDTDIDKEKPDLVYITDTRCPASQAFHAGGGPLIQPFAGGAFSVCMSSDGGVNWRTIPAPSQPAISMGGVTIDPQGRVYAHTLYMPGSVMDFWRYDPAADMWSKVTTAPAEGSLLVVTPTDTHGHVALWLMGTAQEKLVLYRYEV